MEFIKKYNIQEPKLMTEDLMSGCTGSVSAIVEKICAISVDKHENILIDEIVKVAKENGITDLYLLNKTTITEALSKQIPKMPSIYPVVGLAVCPTCENLIEAHASHNYCYYCGQKLEWMRKKD